MNAVDTILFALKAYFRREPDADTAAVETLAEYDATVITEQGPATEALYREAYALGRVHADGRDGRLRDFAPVWTTSDGTDIPVTELRCVVCDGLVQGVGVKHLLDLNALAASHDCQNQNGDQP